MTKLTTTPRKYKKSGLTVPFIIYYIHKTI